jgi:transcription elongation factor GreA
MVSSDHRRRIEQQLAELRGVERPRLLSAMAAVDGKDPADQADLMTVELDLAQVDARIRRLSDLLADEQQTHPAGALPRGATLVLDFGSGPETYRFGPLDVDDGLDVVTPDSPLGHALVGAVAGQRVTYPTPRGPVSVTVVSICVPAMLGPAATGRRPESVSVRGSLRRPHPESLPAG